MNQRTQTPVLIVGAGPTGMVLANELARRQVPVRLIDSKEGPDTTSRSFTLHSKTMETFEHMGIASRFLEDGIESKGFYFNFLGKDEHPALDFTVLESRYPYILVYNQNDTESRLREHLEGSYNISPEWGTSITALEEMDDGFKATLQHDSDNGREEIVHPQWVVGCDGIHSFVRNVMGLEYEGENYDGMLMQMMDVDYDKFEGTDDWTHYYMSEDSFLLITRLPSGKHRILISDMGAAGDPSLTPREAFQQVVDSHFEGSVIGEPEWATQWTIWKRLARDYRKGNALLAGDAAHVHSPSGGQGMNLGMQDAFNLGWKLAMVINGDAKQALLDTYGNERRPVGEQAIGGTESMHDIIMAHGQGMSDRLALTEAEGWHDETVKRISGLSYNYRDVAEAPKGMAPVDGLLVGDRAPDVQLSDKIRLFDLYRHPRMTALIVPARGNTADREHSLELFNTLEQRFARAVKSYVITDEELPGIGERVVKDEAGQLTQIYGSPDSGHLFLVRPDGYLACHCSTGDSGFLLSHLEQWFNASDD